MNIDEKITQCLDRFGRNVRVKTGGTTVECCAVISPMRYKNKMYLDADVSEVGIKDNSRSLYVGPVEVDFTKNWNGTIIESNTDKYSVTRADMVYSGKQPAYVWAVLYKREEG